MVCMTLGLLALYPIGVGHGKFAKPVAHVSSCYYNRECSSPLTCVQGRCRGRGRLGDECDDLQDCTNGARCIKSICSKRSGVGLPCSDYLNDADCLPGLVCMNYKCQHQSTRGGYCQFFWDCIGDLTCIAHVCTDKSEVGGICDNNIDCSNTICRKGLCEKDNALVTTCISGFAAVVAVILTIEVCIWRKWR